MPSVLDLDSPRWAELRHAYGSAADIPDLLRQLESLPPSDGEREPWFSLWSALAHQGDVYTASFAAVPHVVSVLATAPEDADFAYFQFPAWVEICRAQTGMPLPADLSPAYMDALTKLPALVAAAATRPWDDAMLRSALAVAKGEHSLAALILELSSDVVALFPAWLESR